MKKAILKNEKPRTSHDGQRASYKDPYKVNAVICRFETHNSVKTCKHAVM